MNTTTPYRERDSMSVFWPIVMIGAGIILFMNNSSMLTRNPIAMLVDYWPIILVFVGVDVLFSRRGWLGTLISLLMGLAVVGGAILYLTGRL